MSTRQKPSKVIKMNCPNYEPNHEPNHELLSKLSTNHFKSKNLTKYFDIIQFLKNIHLTKYISNIYTRKTLFENTILFFVILNYKKQSNENQSRQ